MICSEKWEGYNGISNLQYTQTLNNKTNFVNPDANAYTQHFEFYQNMHNTGLKNLWR